MNEKILKNENKNSKNLIKIIFIVFIILGVILTLVYCFTKNNVHGESNEKKVVELETYLKENYSKYVIDGSTSMIPLHEALEAKFGQGKKTNHTKTVSSFENFVDGKIDILFAVDYLDEYFKKAEEKNVQINKKAITKEALVFLKNESFSLDNLALEQVKKIFTREYEKWSDIDSSIIESDDEYFASIYRNKDSGSGMALIDLFGKSEIECANDQCIFIKDMGSIINALAKGLGRTSEGKVMIAYNMYTFTEKQYHDESVNNISINGVAPTDETIYSEEYPILLYNYIYYKNDESKEFGEKLYEYLMTTEGQKLIAENGYVPLKKQNDVKIDEKPRNCKENFVEEVCIETDGYNEYVDKYIKITMDNNTENYEYFDTLEEFIFVNSSVTKKEEEIVKEKFKEFFDNIREKKYGYKVTFQKDGDVIVMDSGNCGGDSCISLVPKKSYNFGKELIEINGFKNKYGFFSISNDFKTIYGGTKKNGSDFSIPITDFVLAFDIRDDY